MQDDPPWKSPASPVVEPIPAGEEPRRSRSVVAIVSIAVVVVVAAGVFALVIPTSGTAKAGAETPEELGDRLMTAIEGADVLGAMELLSGGRSEDRASSWATRSSDARCSTGSTSRSWTARRSR
jgi:hypothetical protein